MFYLIYQEDVQSRNFSRDLSLKNIRHWIYIGEDSSQRISVESIIKKEIKRISLADLIEKISWKLRKPFLDWIGELSKTNNSADWWSSEIAAKNPYYMFFIRICLLASVKKIIVDGVDEPILIICSTKALTDGVERILIEEKAKWQYLRRNSLRSMVKWVRDPIRKNIELLGIISPSVPDFMLKSRMAAQFMKRNLSYRRKILKEKGFEVTSFSGERTILFCTWADQRSIKKSSGPYSYHDPYFGPLPGELKKKGYEVAYLTRVLPTAHFDDTVAALKKTGETLFFPEQFFTNSDWFDCRKRALSFSPIISGGQTLQDFPIDQLALAHIDETRQNHIDTLLYEKIFKTMPTRGVLPDLIIYPCEGHSWENAMNHAVRNYLPNTKTVGYENVTFSRMVLSMFHSSIECEIRPFPDRLVTNGELSNEILRESGIPNERLRTGCALRHQYYFSREGKILPIETRKEHPPVRILVATTINTGESVDLISKAISALGGMTGYRVDIKCHPLSDLKKIQEFIGDYHSYGNVIFHETTPVTELLKKAHYVLYGYTTICFDALLYGARPIWMKSENFLNLDKLDSLPELRMVATSPNELRNIILQLETMNGRQRAEWEFMARAALMKAFSPLNQTSIDSFLIH